MTDITEVSGQANLHELHELNLKYVNLKISVIRDNSCQIQSFMQPTGTQIHYYHLCHRKLWLFSNGIQMEQSSALVAEGKFIHETTYAKRSDKFRELDFGFVKIDHFDAKNRVVREVKKSNKLEAVHVAQLKYYLYVMREHGIDGVTGVLEYPKLRLTKEVTLSEVDCVDIEQWILDIDRIIKRENCPPVIKKSFCKSCAYFEFCFV